MKISVIDIGSNSVRIMFMSDGKTIFKRLETTRLGEGVALNGRLLPAAIERTCAAVCNFAALSQNSGYGKPYAFATAAVRSAENGGEFVKAVKAACGVDVEVLSGTDEAKCALIGALDGKDGGVIDIGGASTEITLGKGGQTQYSKSVDIGTVRLYDLAGQDGNKLDDIITQKIAEYGSLNLENVKMYAVGGTATSLASIRLALEEYDPAKIDGSVLERQWLAEQAQKLLSLTPEQRKLIKGMDVRRADVIAGGCLLMYKILSAICVSQVVVSERDNLEGYAILKGLNK